MIDIKMMARKRVANGTGAAKTTTDGSVVYQQNVDEARHAQQADKAIFAEQANKALEANVAARASYANKAQELAEDSTAFSQFLRKDKADTAQKLITFLEGVGLKDGHGITAEGIATLLEVVSANFNEAEQRGFAIHRRADGKYQLSLTDLIVWGKAIFNELELRRLSYVGGNMVFSACGSKVTKVEDKGSTWRCYFRQDDGTTQTQNLWQTDDLARAETFNLKGKTNRHYWRRVTGVGEDWIELSKTDCEQGSDAPQVDDTLVQFGNKTKPERQGLIMLRTMGEQAIIIYSGINGYTLEGKAVALLSPSKVDISASIFRLLATSGEVIDLKGHDGKSSYTFVRYSNDGGKTFTSFVENGDYGHGRNLFGFNLGIWNITCRVDKTINGYWAVKTDGIPKLCYLWKRRNSAMPAGIYRLRGLIRSDGNCTIELRMGGTPAREGSISVNNEWKPFSVTVNNTKALGAPDFGNIETKYLSGTTKVFIKNFMLTMGEDKYDYAPAPEDQDAGTFPGKYLGIASWDKPYPPLDPSVYTWSSTTDKEAMKKAQEAIKTAETASSAATAAATKANDATKRAGEVELKMEQGEFIVRADKTRFQNNKGQDVAVFNSDGTINARAIMAKGTGGTAYFGLYNDAPAMIFTNASGQTTALMTNQGILKPADCVITLRDTKGSMLFKETNGTTIRAYFTYYIAVRVVNTGFQRTLFGDDTLSPHAQLSLSARFEEYAESDMQLRCVEPKWIDPQKEQTIVYRATTDHLYPKRYLSAETEFRVSWYAAFEGKVIMAGNFNAREAASKGEGYVSFDY